MNRHQFFPVTCPRNTCSSIQNTAPENRTEDPSRMEEAIKKSRVLIEALPYIKKFFNKTVVIKFGGNSLHDAKTRKNVLQDMVFMRFAGMRPVLVHGGGPNINDRLEQEKIGTRFIDGLRVT